MGLSTKKILAGTLALTATLMPGLVGAGEIEFVPSNQAGSCDHIKDDQAYDNILLYGGLAMLPMLIGGVMAFYGSRASLERRYLDINKPFWMRRLDLTLLSFMIFAVQFLLAAGVSIMRLESCEIAKHDRTSWCLYFGFFALYVVFGIWQDFAFFKTSNWWLQLFTVLFTVASLLGMTITAGISELGHDMAWGFGLTLAFLVITVIKDIVVLWFAYVYMGKWRRMEARGVAGDIANAAGWPSTRKIIQEALRIPVDTDGVDPSTKRSGSGTYSGLPKDEGF